MMFSQPPMAGFSAILIEGLLEIFFSRLLRESGRLRVERDDVTTAIDQYEEIAAAACILPDILGCVLDGNRIGTGHVRLNDGKVGNQSHVAGQHGFAFVTKVLKSGDGTAQVDRN